MSETRTIPLFPLSSVLFPGMLLPLHIFEPRYRLLLRRIVQADEPFGVVLIDEGTEVGPPATTHRVGTTARVVGATPLPGGRSFVIARGERRFVVEQVDAAREPYLVASVRFLAEDEGAGAGALADRVADAFGQYLSGIMATSPEPRAETPLGELRDGSPREVSYRVAGGLGIDALERQRLLETDGTAARLAALLDLIQRENTLIAELLLRLRARGDAPPLN